MSLRVAVDIGGTFTDLIAFDEPSQRIQQAKSLTTPRDPVEGILDCIHKAALDPKSIDNLIHGSTIAINTLIERKGATVGLIVTSGTRDVYIIGRGNRPEAYKFFLPAAPPRAASSNHRSRREAIRLRRSSGAAGCGKCQSGLRGTGEGWR